MFTAGNVAKEMVRHQKGRKCIENLGFVVPLKVRGWEVSQWKQLERVEKL